MRYIALLICLLASNAWATTYYADPAGGGAASCVDSGANVCTLVRAAAVATNGDTITAACGTYALAGSPVTFATNVTVAPVTSGCATITTTGSSIPVTINAANNAAVFTMSGFVINPAAAASRAISVGALAGYDATIVLQNLTLTSGANSAINDATLRGTLKILNVTGTGAVGVQGWITSQNNATVGTKKIVVSGCNLVLEDSDATQASPVILISRSTTTPQTMYAYINDCDTTLTVGGAVAASYSVIGYQVDKVTNGTDLNGNTTPVIIENSAVRMSTPNQTSGDATAIAITGTNNGAFAHNGIIRNNTITLDMPAGFGIVCGDGTTQSYTDDCQIYGNTIVNSNTVGTPHAIRIGRTNRGRVYSNLIKGNAVGIIAGINDGALITGNVIIGAYYAPLFAKGSGGVVAPTFANNTIIMDDSLYTAKTGAYGCLAAAVSGATNNTATNFYNNSCYVVNGTGWKHAIVDASQAATFANNNYYSMPTLSSPWSYQGAAQTTLAGWQGAQELTALGVDPRFVGRPLTNIEALRIGGSSALRRAGKDLNIGNVQDAGNRAFHHPPSIGAWEATSGDIAATRTLR